MEAKNYPSLQEQYDRLFKNIESIGSSLELLHRDLSLINEDYTITYAVDFHEIRSFVYPDAKSKQPGLVQTTPLQEHSIEKQIARAGLFYGLQPGSQSVLLPPYVTELNKHVALVRGGVLKLQSGFDDEDLRRRLNNIVREDLVRDAINELLQSGKISDEHLTQLQKLLEEKARELFYLISGVSGHGLESIRDILSSDPPLLKVTSFRWPELIPFIEQRMDMPNSKWYELFNEVRSHKEENNEHDAKVIDLVLALNEKLIGKKELVFIVSDTSKMEEVLKKGVTESSKIYVFSETDGSSIKFDEKQDPIPLLRPIEMFYYSILYRDPASSIEQSLENIKNERDRIAQVYIWKKSFDELLEKCGKCLNISQQEICEFQNPCSSMQKQLMEYNDIFSERTNALLAVNRFPILQPYLEQVEKQKTAYEEKFTKGVFSLISFLSSSRDSLEDGIKEMERDLLGQLNDELKEALKAAIGSVLGVSSSYGKEVSEKLDKFNRTHYRIRFHDEVVASTLKRLEEARYAGKVYDVSQAIKQLIDRAFEKSLGPEKSLLWATLLICYRLPENAVSLVNLVLRDVDTEYRAEYLYLRALAYYEMKDFEQVVKECQTDIIEYAGQARFYNLCGFAISRLLEKSDSAGYSWKDAIDYVKKARNLLTRFQDEDDLLATVVNNLAYFHCLRGEVGDIEQALRYVDELEHLTPSLEVIPEFLNTRGCVYKAVALEEENAVEKEQYKARAISDLMRAYELARDTIVDLDEVRAYEKDLRDAEQQLGVFNSDK